MFGRQSVLGGLPVFLFVNTVSRETKACKPILAINLSA